VFGMTRIGTEIKFTLPADQVSAGLTAFGLTDREPERRDVHFVDALDDAGDLRLFGRHVILRIRRDRDDPSRDAGDVTAKLRPAVEDRLTGRWRPGTEHDDDYTVEIDWAQHQVLAASVTVKHDSGIDGFLADPGKRMLNAAQQDFLRKCGPELDKPFRDVRATGPVAALKWKKVTAPGLPGLRAEQWTWGAGNTFLELSLRCESVDEAAAQRELLAAALGSHGLKIDDQATSKTEIVLRDLL
jgi:hypothetical protein